MKRIMLILGYASGAFSGWAYSNNEKLYLVSGTVLMIIIFGHMIVDGMEHNYKSSDIPE